MRREREREGYLGLGISPESLCLLWWKCHWRIRVVANGCTATLGASQGVPIDSPLAGSRDGMQQKHDVCLEECGV